MAVKKLNARVARKVEKSEGKKSKVKPIKEVGNHEDFETENSEEVDELINELVDDIPEMSELIKEKNVYEDQEILTSVSSLDLAVHEQDARKEKIEVQDLSELQYEVPDGDLRKKIVDLRLKIDDSRFDLGILLCHVEKMALYKEWGYESMANYIDSCEAGNPRTIRYLLALQHWFIEEVKDPEKIAVLKKLGWSKAKEIMILRLDVEHDPEELDHWAKQAQSLSLKQLSTEVKAIRDQKKFSDRPLDEKVAIPDEPRQMNFKLYPEDYEFVAEALKKVEKETNTQDANKNIAKVCQVALMDMEITEDPKKNAVKWAKIFEARTNLRVIIVDDGTPIYGGELLEQN